MNAWERWFIGNYARNFYPGEWVTQIHLGFWNINNHLISSRQIDLIIFNIKKRTCRIVDFAVPADHRENIKESEKKDNSLELAKVLKENMEYENNVYINCYWCSWYSHQRFGKTSRGLGNKRTNGDNPALLRSARILGRVRETWGNLLWVKLHWDSIS